ncbi:hypothetical protein Nepgr_029779 [Nepenthes gracilis]|uniref:Uncharacterized protein n=1 Tax=Nepenthes gracilis TaxID=150966 RepID=A0AAD3TFP0_NEPGR|nr:hypothetical protein Nepgr_029779 [Nepenthes gracilis]
MMAKKSKKSKEALSKGGANVLAKQLAVMVLSIKDIASMMDLLYTYANPHNLVDYSRAALTLLLQVVAMHENVVTTSSLATPSFSIMELPEVGRTYSGGMFLLRLRVMLSGSKQLVLMCSFVTITKCFL